MYKSLLEVREAYLHGKNLNYIFFWGHTPPKDGSINMCCFSQWYPSNFAHDNFTYSNCEQFMMAHKAKLFGDNEMLHEILHTIDPKSAKALGRKVKNFNEDIWKENRFKIVTEGNFAKFAQNEELKKFLLTTNDSILVEASPYDRIWGIGMGKSNENINNPMSWRGQNLLGFALMEVRERLLH